MRLWIQHAEIADWVIYGLLTILIAIASARLALLLFAELCRVIKRRRSAKRLQRMLERERISRNETDEALERLALEAVARWQNFTRV